MVILGDSITAGYGLDDPAKAYPRVLQTKIDQAGLQFEIANAGVSGDTTAGGLRRVDWTLSRGAAVFIVALGGNDGLRGLSPEQTEANLRAIIKRAREKAPAAAVIVAGMQMPDSMGPDYTGKFREVFPRVAHDTNAALIPFLLEGIGGDPAFNQADGIHPNPAGHQCVADNVWKILEKTLRENANSQR